VRTLRQSAFALLFGLAFALVFIGAARAEDPLPLVKSKPDPQPAASATSPPIAPASGSPAGTKTRPAGKARGRETAVKPAAASVPAVSTLPPSVSAPPHNEIAEAQPADATPDPSPPPQTPAVPAANAKPPSQTHVFILIGALVVLGVMTLRAGRG
jgi:hypothetical protein